VDRVEAAIEDALQAARHEPDNFENYMVLIEVYRIHGSPPHQAEEAMGMLELANEIEPMNPEIHLLRGEIFWFEFGDEVNAQMEYDLAVELGDPDWPGGVDSRAFFYSETGRCELAIEDLTRAIELAPENPNPYRLRGDCHSRLLNPEQANADYQTFMVMTKGDPNYDEERKLVVPSLMLVGSGRTSVFVSADGASDGLAVASGGDWDTRVEIVPAGTQPVWIIFIGEAVESEDGNTTPDWYLGFLVDDNFLYKGLPTRQVIVEVEYLDVGTDTFGLSYDSTIGPWKSGGIQRKQDSGEFRVAAFTLSQAYFGNRSNGADFRLDSNSDGIDHIRRVTVTLMVP
jgi:tetratricopeptide (TPR) repeat protein